MSAKTIILVGIIGCCLIPVHAATPLCQALMRSSQAEVDKALSLIEAGADVNETCGSVRDFRPLDLVINQVSQKFDIVAEAMIKRGAVVGGAYPDSISFPSPERRTEFEAYLKDRQQPSFAMSPSEVRYAIAKHRGDMRAAQDASNAEYLERATRKQNETLRAFGQAALAVGGTIAAAKIAQSNALPAATQALPKIQPSVSGGAAVPAQIQTAQRTNATVAASSQSPSWQQCGPENKCLIGDGLAGFCSGPYDPAKPMCKSECAMDSLAFYHDTTLKPGAYIGGAGRCPARSCNAINSC